MSGIQNINQYISSESTIVHFIKKQNKKCLHFMEPKENFPKKSRKPKNSPALKCEKRESR